MFVSARTSSIVPHDDALRGVEAQAAPSVKTTRKSANSLESPGRASTIENDGQYRECNQSQVCFRRTASISVLNTRPPTMRAAYNLFLFVLKDFTT